MEKQSEFDIYQMMMDYTKHVGYKKHMRKVKLYRYFIKLNYRPIKLAPIIKSRISKEKSTKRKSKEEDSLDAIFTERIGKKKGDLDNVEVNINEGNKK